jgi:hypothetical protein
VYQDHDMASCVGVTNTTDQSPSWKVTDHQLLRKFPAFYGTPGFITAFTRARHLSLSCAWSSQSMPTPRSNLILSFHLRLGLPNGQLPLEFPTKTQYAPLLSPFVLHAPPISVFPRKSIPDTTAAYSQATLRTA